MESWGNGRGTALVLLIGIILIAAAWTIDTVLAIPIAALGAMFVGLGIGIFLAWFLFTDRKLEDLFAA